MNRNETFFSWMNEKDKKRALVAGLAYALTIIILLLFNTVVPTGGIILLISAIFFGIAWLYWVKRTRLDM